MASRSEHSEALSEALNPFTSVSLEEKERRIREGESLPAIRYVSDHGDFVVRNFNLGKAPTFIMVDDVKFRRAAGSIPRFAKAGFNKYPKVSKALPQWCAGAEHTDHGEPIIESDTHERELCRMHGFTREYHHSDMEYRDREQADARKRFEMGM